MSLPSYLPIYEITRGQTAESVHFGAIAVVDAQGNLAASYGDHQAVTFLRSTAKPFQALPFMEHGGQETYQLTQQEIALICASHSGTDEHVAVARAIQAKSGVRERDLMCGVHTPFHRPTVQAMQARGENPTPNRHNCSGKHTGMLAYARMKDLPIPRTDAGVAYIDPEHAVQREILASFAAMCDLRSEQVALGTDGCSVPTFAVPLYNTALAFARLCDPEGGQVESAARVRACRVITSSMVGHPEMVGGPDSFDTRLMHAARGRILSKVGAEGYLAMGIMPGALKRGSPALGIALKISDGDLAGHSRPVGDPYAHARPAVALEVLRQIGALEASELSLLAQYGPTFTIHNWREIEVGVGRPCFQLKVEG
jgi:L-asparaginase II